jgi:hypothetical protein
MSNSLSRAKPLLALRVKQELDDINSPYCLQELCNCRKHPSESATVHDDIAAEMLDDEKEEELALLGLLELRQVEGELTPADVEDDNIGDSQDHDGS